MTHRELYLWTKQELASAGIEDPGVETMLLFSHFFGLDRAGLALRERESPPPERETAFLEAVAQRRDRRPLQYILGEWDFMGLTLALGEGVLCPREDTAALVEAAAQRLDGRSRPVGLDLCAGTGAVALGLCSLTPGAEVICVELSGEALPYLERNLAAYPQYRARARRGDVLSPETAGAFAPGSLDFILSNPPYVRTEVLPALQPEVQKEPALALDGGQDGLVFYRAICAHWLPLLKPGGVLGVEIGEEQGPAVRALLEAHGLTDVEVRRDWGGLERVVIGNTKRLPGSDFPRAFLF